MRLSNRPGLVALSMIGLTGCNMVMSDKPLFVKADGLTAPPIHAGVWRTERADCAFDEHLPQSQWPKCAEASPGVGDPPFWTEVAGDPDLLQTPLPIPGMGGSKTSYIFLAFRPLALDDRGRVIAMKSWPVKCGPPPPPDVSALADTVSDLRASAVTGSPVEAPAGLYSPTDPSSLTRIDPTPAAATAAAPPPAADRPLAIAPNLAKLAADSRRLSESMLALSPTKAPLPGLTMNEMGGCAPASAAAVRAAAKASEAWADASPVSHWVRERKPGDLPPASANNLMASPTPN